MAVSWIALVSVASKDLRLSHIIAWTAMCGSGTGVMVAFIVSVVYRGLGVSALYSLICSTRKIKTALQCSEVK